MLFSVEDDSSAEKAGLSVGDILVQFDEETVEDLNDLHRLLTSDLINKTVEVHVIRGGQKLQLKVSPTELSQP